MIALILQIHLRSAMDSILDYCLYQLVRPERLKFGKRKFRFNTSMIHVVIDRLNVSPSLKSFASKQRKANRYSNCKHSPSERLAPRLY